MNSFPSVSWFRDFAAYLEKDVDFAKHGRWLQVSIAVRVDREIVVLRLDRGLVLDVSAGHGEADFLIWGSRDQWDHLFVKKWGLVRLYRSQTLGIRGDTVRLMQNWKPIFFVVEAMKRFDEQLATQS